MLCWWTVLCIVLLSVLDFYVMTSIFHAVMNVNVGIDVLMNVMLHGSCSGRHGCPVGDHLGLGALRSCL